MASPVNAGGVLIVEDNSEVRETLAEVLTDRGYEVTTAANGKEAMESLHSSTRPDLILLNLAMPVMNGWSFRREQEQDPELADIPVVLLSGQSDLAREAAALHIKSWLKKPIELGELLGLVNRHCMSPPN